MIGYHKCIGNNPAVIPHLEIFSQIPEPVFLTLLFLLPFPVSFIFLTLRLIKGSDNIPYNEIFLHIIPSLPVFSKGLFFLRYKPDVFRSQNLLPRGPLDTQFTKCFLFRLMNRDLFAVNFKEFLSSVPRLKAHANRGTAAPAFRKCRSIRIFISGNPAVAFHISIRQGLESEQFPKTWLRVVHSTLLFVRLRSAGSFILYNPATC